MSSCDCREGGSGEDGVNWLDIVWFDTGHGMPSGFNFKILKAMREANPDVITGARLGFVHDKIERKTINLADYMSTCDGPAEFPPNNPDRDWEAIPTLNHSYAYSRLDTDYKDSEHFIKLTCKAVARGGNMLIAIGPRADGTFAENEKKIFRGLGDWMKIYGDSIYGTVKTPLPKQGWGESALKGNKIYLHVFKWPEGGKFVVGGLKTSVKKAYLLSDKKKSSLPCQRLNDFDYEIKVPESAPNDMVSVIVLEVSGNPVCTGERLLMAHGTDVLHVYDGEKEGKINWGQGGLTRAHVQDWKDTDSSVYWPVYCNEKKRYKVYLEHDNGKKAEGSVFCIDFGGKVLEGKIEAPEKLTEYYPGRKYDIHRQGVGEVVLDKGLERITVRAKEIKGGEFARVRSVVLEAK